MEVVILLKEFLEAAIFLYLLKSNALKRSAFDMEMLTFDDTLYPISLKSQPLTQTFRPRQQQIHSSHYHFLSFIIIPLPSRSNIFLFAYSLPHVWITNIIQDDNGGLSRFIHNFPSLGRGDKHDRCETVRLSLIWMEVEEAMETCGFFFELLDPCIEHGEGKLVLVAFMEEAVADHDSVEVAPLRDLRGQTVLDPNLFFPFIYLDLYCLDQTE